jgi:hypothetical protein
MRPCWGRRNCRRQPGYLSATAPDLDGTAGRRGDRRPGKKIWTSQRGEQPRSICLGGRPRVYSGEVRPRGRPVSSASVAPSSEGEGRSSSRLTPLPGRSRGSPGSLQREAPFVSKYLPNGATVGASSAVVKRLAAWNHVVRSRGARSDNVNYRWTRHYPHSRATKLTGNSTGPVLPLSGSQRPPGARWTDVSRPASTSIATVISARATKWPRQWCVPPPNPM